MVALLCEISSVSSRRSGGDKLFSTRSVDVSRAELNLRRFPVFHANRGFFFPFSGQLARRIFLQRHAGGRGPPQGFWLRGGVMVDKRKSENEQASISPGWQANGAGVKLRSFAVGAMPIINRILQRMRLSEILSETLPPDDKKTRLPTHRALTLLIRNVLCSREPMYGVAQWAALYAPDLLNLFDNEVELLNDDRMGRGLDHLFNGLDADLIMKVVRHVIAEFNISLSEFHNDSTSLSFYGAYHGDDETRWVRGRKTLAITYGHSKDHRPDLKQVLYILTISEDGGVPMYFTAADGNTTDDTTHKATWNLLRELVGHSEFLYVADCKLATTENMKFIDRQGGRFVTVLPRSRKENRQFRQRFEAKPESIRWTTLYQIKKTYTIRGKQVTEVVDQLEACSDECISHEGFRLIWYRSTRKMELDRQRRAKQLDRAMRELHQLRTRLQGPKTRFDERQKVQQELQKVLRKHKVEGLVDVDILEEEVPRFKQTKRGRPTKNMTYTKTTKLRFDLTWAINYDHQRELELQDGIFPLISNDKEMAAEGILRAYKRQPVIEKRFSQLKTDFGVAPIFLKSVTRIHGLLAVYFFALMVQTLLERELRQAMQDADIQSLPIYPEGRLCRRPTTRKLIDFFAGIQRHEVRLKGQEPQYIVTQLTPEQKQILKLLRIPTTGYGQ